MNGFDVLRQLRLHSETPVLMLTARGDDVDRIVGLEMGADDYLPKPFNPRELIARIRAILRRLKSETEDSTPPEQLEIGDVSLDRAMRVVTRAGERLALTAVEFGLLAELHERRRARCHARGSCQGHPRAGNDTIRPKHRHTT
jgi:two-component system response regulator CpxR